MRNEDTMTYNAGEEVTAGSVNAIEDARIMLKGNYTVGRKICNVRELEAYCRELVGYSAVEEFHLLCMDCGCNLISEATISRGDLSSVSTPVPNIAKVALLSNARSVFLTHNHPGGTCAPSAEDLKATGTIKSALKMFDVEVLDHLIVTTNNGCYSMRQHGDI